MKNHFSKTTSGIIECPFCDSFTCSVEKDIELLGYKQLTNGNLDPIYKTEYYILCIDCKGRGPIAESEEEAKRLWNAE